MQIEVIMPKSKINNKQILIISTVIFFVAILGLIFYYNYKIDKLNNDFNAKLSGISEKINQLEQNLDDKMQNLTMEIQLIDTNFRSFKSKNEEEINTLTDLIDEIEKQSEIQLGELKEELSSIQVESKDFSAIIDNVLESVVSVGTNKGLGSGAIIDDRGFIVTNFHVVDGARIIRVLTYDNKVYDAALIGYNDVVDVAVIKVDASLPRLRFGDSDDVKVGERVIALGNPAGLSFTVTEGIVSAVHRTGSNNLKIYLQTDVPINPGNSGGPLVDTNSRIIGINNFKISGFEGLGFAIESNTVKQITDDIIDNYYQKIGQ